MQDSMEGIAGCRRSTSNTTGTESQYKEPVRPGRSSFRYGTCLHRRLGTPLHRRPDKPTTQAPAHSCQRSQIAADRPASTDLCHGKCAAAFSTWVIVCHRFHEPSGNIYHLLSGELI